MVSLNENHSWIVSDDNITSDLCSNLIGGDDDYSCAVSTRISHMWGQSFVTKWSLLWKSEPIIFEFVFCFGFSIPHVRCLILGRQLKQHFKLFHVDFNLIHQSSVLIQVIVRMKLRMICCHGCLKILLKKQQSLRFNNYQEKKMVFSSFFWSFALSLSLYWLEWIRSVEFVLVFLYFPFLLLFYSNTKKKGSRCSFSLLLFFLWDVLFSSFAFIYLKACYIHFFCSFHTSKVIMLRCVYFSSSIYFVSFVFQGIFFSFSLSYPQ